jgi:dUTP pyrophosphatase
VAVEIPDGHAGLVLSRSGLAARHGISCLNAPGLIDPGYRGELAVILVNTDPDTPYEVHRGDRIAQLVICRVEEVRFLVVDQLGTSERGAGGFGHSGR